MTAVHGLGDPGLPPDAVHRVGGQQADFGGGAEQFVPYRDGRHNHDIEQFGEALSSGR